jgi:hypothetical protein
MTQLTLRGFGRELEQALRRLAKEDGISLNQAALILLRKGAGLSGGVPRLLGSVVDEFSGTLSDEDATAVEKSVRDADRADLEFQRRSRGKP